MTSLKGLHFPSRPSTVVNTSRVPGRSVRGESRWDQQWKSCGWCPRSEWGPGLIPRGSFPTTERGWWLGDSRGRCTGLLYSQRGTMAQTVGCLRGTYRTGKSKHCDYGLHHRVCSPWGGPLGDTSLSRPCSPTACQEGTEIAEEAHQAERRRQC